MNILFLTLSLFLSSFVLSDVIVTVTHPVAVTLTYDPVLGSVLPYVPTVTSEQSDESHNMLEQQEDLEGKVNAKATASTRSNTTLLTSGKYNATGATTDVSSAFKMSLPFAFGTVAAIILAAIVF